MSGGIAQLVAIGAQDAHIVGDPQVSFFKSTYKRHTNFTSVVDRQVIQGNPSNNGMSTVRFERKGDLLNYVYFVKKSGNQVVNFDANDIARVELLIGGQVIDDQDYTFSTDLAQHLLTTTDNKASTVPTNSNFYPLHFFFCENWQSSIPLVALQYHDVELRITWGSSVGSDNYECWSEFIYLDNNEREAVANGKVDMLIYQVQKAVKSNGKIQELNFNHPVKFLCANADIISSPTTATLQFQINGVDVGERRNYTPHFNRTPFYFHSPYDTNPLHGGSFLYPFCLDTNRLQPTGTLNFSRLDSARLITDEASGFNQADIYGVNYNILRIQNGMGGLLYAN